MRLALALLVVATLASCGVDGEPVRPTASATIGVGSGGVYGGAAAGISKGPVSIGIGLF